MFELVVMLRVAQDDVDENILLFDYYHEQYDAFLVAKYNTMLYCSNRVETLKRAG